MAEMNDAGQALAVVTHDPHVAGGRTLPPGVEARIAERHGGRVDFTNEGSSGRVQKE